MRASLPPAGRTHAYVVMLLLLGTSACTPSDDPQVTRAFAPPRFLELVTVDPRGDCGTTLDESGDVAQRLGCGTIVLGGGRSVVAPTPVPNGTRIRFGLADCDATSCEIVPVPGGGDARGDCSDANCPFGPPLPVENGANSSCLLAGLSAPARGRLDITDGETTELSIELAVDLFLTAHAVDPCPRCSASGTPDQPGAGTCTRGAREGSPCTSTNSHGLSRDCPPGGTDGSVALGRISIKLGALRTAQQVAANDDGFFCSGQKRGQAGCFANGKACRRIELRGSPPARLTIGQPARGILTSVFCIDAVNERYVDAAANLPGPGAIILAADFTLLQ